MALTLSLEIRAFLKTCEQVDSPRSLSCWILVNNGEYQQYMDLPKPVNPATFKGDYLVTEMLRKNADIVLPQVDKKRVAIESFIRSEELCRRTNARIIDALVDPDGPPEILRRVSYWVRRILGSLSVDKLQYAEHSFRFGPGATSSCGGIDVLPSIKYACDVHTTQKLYPFAKSIMGYSWFASNHGSLIVNETSELTTVPKNAKTDRCICIEPHLNIYYQLGVGAVIRRQLKRFGFNLDNLFEWNRFLASNAQSWRLSTIDLKAASDTISLNVVKALLPREWYEFLNLGRTDHTMVDGVPHQLEKFSSMGNGYTFELETLIFLATCLAAGCDRKLLSVFGDDIVCESNRAPEVIEYLSFLGFEVNRDKTFLEGNFFESCGHDFYDGVNVRPVYFRGDYHDMDDACFQVANKIRRWSTRRNGNDGFLADPAFFPVWWLAFSKASKLARCTSIPDGAGDNGFVRTEHEVRLPYPGRLRDAGWEGLFGLVLPTKPVRSKRTITFGAYLLSLQCGTGDDAPREREFIRGVVRRSTKLRDVHIWQWTGVGAW